MARGDQDPRFVHEFELGPTPQQARILGIRLDLARQMYNAFLAIFAQPPNMWCTTYSRVGQK
jgi:hypothetical protein